MGAVTFENIDKIYERNDDGAGDVLSEVTDIETSASLEVRNVAEMARFLSDLGGTVAKKSFDYYQSIISRTSDVELDILNLPFHLYHLTWEQLCRLHSDAFGIVNPSEGETRDDNEIMLSEFISDKDKPRTVLVNKNALIPYIENADMLRIITRTKKQINHRGLIIIQEKSNNTGMFNFITFTQGKKIVGLYTSDGNNNTRQFYHVSHVKIEEPVPNISLPDTASVRPLTDVLSENDKIKIVNSSPRFRKKVDSLNTVKDIIEFLNASIMNTVDYTYINKLIELNFNISYLPS